MSKNGSNFPSKAQFLILIREKFCCLYKNSEAQAFYVIPGQYLFLNVPSIALLHGIGLQFVRLGANGVIKLLIKNAVDFYIYVLGAAFKRKIDFIVENFGFGKLLDDWTLNVFSLSKLKFLFFISISLI